MENNYKRHNKKDNEESDEANVGEHKVKIILFENINMNNIFLNFLLLIKDYKIKGYTAYRIYMKIKEIN